MWSFPVAVFAVIASLQSAATAPMWDDIQELVLGDQASTASSIRSALKKAQVIPDVLDGDFRPLFSINVTYPKWEKGVDLGNKIKPKAVSSSPDVIVHAIDNDSNTIPTPTVRSNVTYTFVLTDPDATSRSDPTMAEMCHWIVAGIHLNTSSEGQVLNLPVELEAIVDAVGSHGSPPRRMGHNSGVEELMSYYAPAPPPKTGYHRYVFVILAPKSNEKRLRIDTELKKPKERPHWGYGKVGKGVRDWAKDNGLTPVGANFFYATNKKQ